MTGRKRRAQDPLTAALSDIFLPAVRPFGFDRKSARLIVRISNGILQLLNFQKSGFGGGERADFVVLTAVRNRTFRRGHACEHSR